MASSTRSVPGKQSGTSEEDCRAVLARVAKSKLFEKSARSRELLNFLGSFALGHEDESLSEQRIGTSVFGREPGYDTAVDTIARVQVSQLRKKLKDYFSSEGADERVVIDIPLGSYVLTFHVREPEPTAAPSVKDAPVPSQVSSSQTWKYTAGAMFAILCALLIWIVAGKPQTRNASLGAGEPWDTFWKPFLSDNRDLPVVISDANLMIVSRMLGRVVTLHEYRDPNYPESLIDLFHDQKTRELAKTILGNYYTGTQDTRVVNDLATVTLRYRVQVNVVPAREFRLNPGAPGNLVLVGHNHGNPWFELFDGRLNFHYVWPEGATAPMIVNRDPRPGESPEYPVQFQKSGYCAVSYRPRPDGHGSALLVVGTDLSSLDAGGRFITEANWLRSLYATLGVRPSGRIPFFEILLKTDLLASGSPGFQIVASRID